MKKQRQPSRPTSLASKQIFPVRLHRCINENHGSAVRWVENGAAFSIFDIVAFARDILPKHLGTMTLNKFAHLLSIHGFKRTSHKHTTQSEGKDQESKIYTFRCALFTKDASPSNLVTIRPQRNYCKSLF